MTTPAQDPQDTPAADAPAPAPATGTVILHESYDVRAGENRDLAMIVIGSGVSEGGETQVHALTLGWADQFATLAADDYRPA